MTPDYLDKIQMLIKRDFPDVPDHLLQPETKLADLGIDSLGFVELIFGIESELNITLPDETLISSKTIGDFITAIKLQIEVPQSL